MSELIDRQALKDYVSSLSTHPLNEWDTWGVIDEGYTGSIKVKLYNLGRKPYTFNRGDKIAQLIIQPCLYVPVEIGEINKNTERGDNGFGSAGV